jgi:hypothetical protein
MNLVKQLFLILGFAIIVFGSFNILKIFVLSRIKVKINKWLVLGASIIVFIAQVFLGQKSKLLPMILLSALSVLLFLWFMDLNGFNNRKDKKKEIIIKPKAKPNRVKNNK